jgi:hypothetical protein
MIPVPVQCFTPLRFMLGIIFCRLRPFGKLQLGALVTTHIFVLFACQNDVDFGCLAALARLPVQDSFVCKRAGAAKHCDSRKFGFGNRIFVGNDKLGG